MDITTRNSEHKDT